MVVGGGGGAGGVPQGGGGGAGGTEHSGPFTIPGPATNAVVIGAGGPGRPQGGSNGLGSSTTLTFPGTPVTYSAYGVVLEIIQTPTLVVVDLVVVDRMEQHLVDLLRIQQQTQVLQSTVIMEQTTVWSTHNSGGGGGGAGAAGGCWRNWC